MHMLTLYTPMWISLYIQYGSSPYSVPSTTDPALDISIKNSLQYPTIGESYLRSYFHSGVIALGDIINSYISTKACNLHGGNCPSNININTIGGVEFPAYKYSQDLFWTNVG